MKALVFLTLRSFLNSVKRALTSPKRLLGLLFFGLYYAMIFRPAMRTSQSPDLVPAQARGQVEFPPMDLVDAVVFSGFSFITLVLALGIFNLRGGFKSADVDVLFPTPISPKIVIAFRLVRDTLFTLILPLIFAAIFYRPAMGAWTSLFRGMPNAENAELVLRYGLLAYFLLALGWVSLGYAFSLFFNRPIAWIERLRSILTWSFVLGIVALGGYLTIRVRTAMDVPDLLHIADSLALRIPLFLAWAATAFALSPIQGGQVSGVLGLSALLGFIGLGVAMAMRQSGWVYDLAATRIQQMGDTQKLMQSGDTYAIVAHRARSQKKRIRGVPILNRVRWSRAGGLVWRELIFLYRAQLFMLILFVAISLLMLVPVLAIDRFEAQRVFALFMLGLTVLMGTGSVAQSGFIETLRRVDLLKPLPFASMTLAFAEVIAKAVVGLVPVVPFLIGLLILRPQQAETVLVGLVLAPGVSLVIASVVFLVTVLFPDFDDPTQRGFRGMVSFLAQIVMVGPVVGLMIALSLAGLPLVPAALLSTALALALGIMAAVASGTLYEGYNPSE